MAVVGLGCPADDPDDDPTATSAASSSDPATSADPGETSVAETTSTNPADDDAFCAGFLDADSCIAADFEGPGTCVWETIWVVSMSEGQCAVDAMPERCLATAFDSTDPGCSAFPGCDTEPYYRVDGSQFETISTCGGTPPNGFEPCTFVSEGVFEPAECVCLCEALAGGG